MNLCIATRRSARVRVLVLVGLVATSSTSAQTWRITPSISVVDTLTDNVELTPSDRKKSDLITQVVPAIRIDGTGGRLKVNLNYVMQNLLYAHDSTHNTAQHYLSSQATLEAVENWLFVDATANISQQAISAFAPQPGTDGNVNN